MLLRRFLGRECVLYPCQWHYEQRREKEPEERVDPDQRRVECAEPEPRDDDPEWSTERMFHGAYLSRMTVKRKAVAAGRVRSAVEAIPPGRYLLAVSGGRDSMVLMDAFARARSDIAAVATFDHGTGSAATRAARHVEFEASRRGLPVVSGVHIADGKPKRGRAPSEESLRNERWRFLRDWADEFGAAVLTAHTEDDQIETVFMRILRESGARGLAGMYAPTEVIRPLLGVRRTEVAAYAAAEGVHWIDDPSNTSRDYLRNRVRAEILPAIEAIHPHFGRLLLHVAREAAELRAEVASIVDSLGVVSVGPTGNAAVRGTANADRTAMIPAAELAAAGGDGHMVLWPEIAGRAGIQLDWRGIERLARQASTLKPGGRIPLSGGATLERTVASFVFRNLGPGSRLY